MDKGVLLCVDDEIIVLTALKDQLRRAFAVDLQGFAGGFFGKAQGAFQLAAGNALAQRFTYGAFEVAERLGQA